MVSVVTTEYVFKAVISIYGAGAFDNANYAPGGFYNALLVLGINGGINSP